VLSQLETVLIGSHVFAKTCDKKIQARSSASMSRKVGMNRAILVRWHTTTKIVSCPFDRGSPSMKSIEIEVPRSFPNWEEPVRAEWLVMQGLAAAADQTRVNVIGDKGTNSGPIELPTNILDGLGDAGVSCQTVVVVGAKDVQSDLLIVRDIEQSLVAKEVAIL